MRLAAKLILLFLGGLLLIVAAFAFLTIRREKQITIEQHQRYAAELAEWMENGRGEPSKAPAETQAENSSRAGTQSLIRVRRVELSSTAGTRTPAVPRERLFVSEKITTITMTDPSGLERLYTYVPIEQESEPTASSEPESNAKPEQPTPEERYEVSAPDTGSANRVRRTILTSLATLICVSGLSGLVIYYGGIRMVGRPLDRLITKVHRIADGELEPPVTIAGRDELAHLGAAINEMCARLEQQRQKIESETRARVAAVEQLRHADRLRSVGRIAAGLAHEIGTPLNVVSGHAELIESGDLSGEAIRQSCRQIKTETDRIAAIISNVLAFARQQTSHRRRDDVRPILRSTCELLEPVAARCGATLKLDLPNRPVVANVDSGQIQQVLTNLINNAIQSSASTVTVRIGVDQQQTGDMTETRIIVADDGDGMPDEVREHLFEPFFTTKDVGEGTGLGLAISLGMVHEHGGEIEVDSVPGGGSTFTVVLRDGEHLSDSEVDSAGA